MNQNELLKKFPNASKAFLKANESRTVLSIGDNGQTSKLESNSSNAPLGEKEIQRQDSQRFLVRITSHRKRLIDEDNLCEKYHVDLCRYAGVVAQDSPDKCKIEVGQIKVKKGEPEKIVIEVFEIE